MATLSVHVHLGDFAQTQKVFLSGNLPQLGQWKPDAIPLRPIGHGLFHAELSAPAGALLEYKFTLGSWDQEAADELGNPLPNFRTLLTDSASVSHKVPRWKSAYPWQGPGRVELLPAQKGNGLLPRTVAVWLPPGYDAQPGRKFPLLYVLDGQNAFDPSTAAFGIDWRLGQTAAMLIQTGRMEPVIIAAVYNTPDRNAEYGFGEKGHAFARFLGQSLRKELGARYRLQQGPEGIAVMGSSMGGLSAFFLAWQYPKWFGKAASLSPAFKTRRWDYVAQVCSTSILPRPRLYLDMGGRGVDSYLIYGLNDMLKALDSQGITYQYFYEKDAPHNETAWGRRAWRPLTYLFGT